jgi:hypothetical protein
MQLHLLTHVTWAPALDVLLPMTPSASPKQANLLGQTHLLTCTSCPRPRPARAKTSHWAHFASTWAPRHRPKHLDNHFRFPPPRKGPVCANNIPKVRQIEIGKSRHLLGIAAKRTRAQLQQHLSDSLGFCGRFCPQTVGHRGQGNLQAGQLQTQPPFGGAKLVSSCTFQETARTARGQVHNECENVRALMKRVG